MDEGQEAVFSLRDEGIGIAPEVLPRIFDLFVQGERALARSEGGMGLGLTLVRQIVALHGGRVEAKSGGPGHGSEFIVRLPLRPAPPRRTGPGRTPPRTAARAASSSSRTMTTPAKP